MRFDKSASPFLRWRMFSHHQNPVSAAFTYRSFRSALGCRTAIAFSVLKNSVTAICSKRQLSPHFVCVQQLNNLTGDDLLFVLFRIEPLALAQNGQTCALAAEVYFFRIQTQKIRTCHGTAVTIFKRILLVLTL